MTSIVELFPKSRKLAYDARQQLSQVQNHTLHPSSLLLSLEELSRQLSIMESLLQHETPTQREMWKRKIYELRQDTQSIQRSCEYYQRVYGEGYRQQRERDELMAMRRRRTTTTTNGTNEYGHEMNHLSSESDSLQQSNQMVNEILLSGQASLSGLIEQRHQLKGVKRVLLDMGNTLGLSNSLMRIVERRDVTDAYLVAGGMVVTLLVMYICWLR